MKKTRFVELPEQVVDHLKNKLDKDYDILAFEYFTLIDGFGKQTVLASEFPQGFYPNRVQRVLRPYLRDHGYRFGYRNLSNEVVMWGFLKAN